MEYGKMKYEIRIAQMSGAFATIMDLMICQVCVFKDIDVKLSIRQLGGKIRIAAHPGHHNNTHLAEALVGVAAHPGQVRQHARLPVERQVPPGDIKLRFIITCTK